MSAELALNVQGVSKCYEIYAQPKDRLKQLTYPKVQQLFGHKPRTYYRAFWALQDISFELRKGETLGIIGRNGSGKSTLLQILAGTLTPTTGQIAVNGRVAALLELGSGFNPEFTGKENIMMNAQILGLSLDEIKEKYHKIVAFADIGAFINQPVKTYSSGMYVRLAFAVQAHVDASILIIDEALGVGDIFFQQKCFSRLKELLANGTSLLFVSHDMQAVQNLCAQTLLLQNGICTYLGPSDVAATKYYSMERTSPPPTNTTHPPATKPNKEGSIDEHNLLDTAHCIHGEGGIEFLTASLIVGSGLPGLVAQVEEQVDIKLQLHASRAFAHLACGLHLYDRFNNLVFAAGTHQLGVELPPMESGATRWIHFRLTLNLTPGAYTFSLGCSETALESPNFATNLCRAEGLGPIRVVAKTDNAWPFFGIAKLPLEISVESL